MATAGTWRALQPPISEEILEVLEDELGFDQMTPVQAACIPSFLSNKDVAVEAATGSGKTLAFVIPIIELLLRRPTPLKKHEVGAIVVIPVRELATQIYQVLQVFVKRFPQFSTMLLTGGASTLHEDVERFKTAGASIVIGCPGRLEYVMANCSDFRVKELEVLIMDEADRLLEMGFQTSLTNIVGKLPKQRRTGLFSATQTNQVVELIRAGMRNPVKVTIKVENSVTNNVQRIPKDLQSYYTFCESDEKLGQLVKFLEENQDKKFIVYFLTCDSVNFHYSILSSLPSLKGFPICSIHGQVPHEKRTAIYKKFLDTKSAVLLSTDLTSRGLDIPDVDWIIQFDPPQSPDAFIHRIGRTARIGKPGKALVYLLPHEDTLIGFLAIRKVPMEELPKLENTPNLIPSIKARAKTERELMEKAILAFATHVRAYREHQCKYIFQLNKLDMGKLAESYALLKFPEFDETDIPNLLNVDYPETVSDLDTVPYKNRTREKIRQEKLKKKKEEDAAAQAERPKKDQNGSKKRKAPDGEKADEAEEDFADDFKKLKKGKKKGLSGDEDDDDMLLLDMKVLYSMNAKKPKKAKKEDPKKKKNTTDEKTLVTQLLIHKKQKNKKKNRKRKDPSAAKLEL